MQPNEPDSSNASQPFEGVIFLPGLMCDERLFAPQLAALKSKYACEVARLDADATFDAMAERIFSNTAFDRFALAGLSMGGSLAMHIARVNPHRVARLALLDANPHSDDAARRATRNEQYQHVLDKGFESLIREQLVEKYLAPKNQTEEMIHLLISMAENLGTGTFRQQLDALMARNDCLDSLASYNGKSLVLCGELDVMCAPELHHSMANRLPNSHLTIIPGCGHLSTLEAPGAVNEALFDWLN